MLPPCDVCADLQGPLTATLGYMFVLATRGGVLDRLTDNIIRTLVSNQGTSRGMNDAIGAETQQTASMLKLRLEAPLFMHGAVPDMLPEHGPCQVGTACNATCQQPSAPGMLKPFHWMEPFVQLQAHTDCSRRPVADK